jgi:hypothetical protein
LQPLLNPLGKLYETLNKERSHCVDVHIIKELWPLDLASKIRCLCNIADSVEIFYSLQCIIDIFLIIRQYTRVIRQVKGVIAWIQILRILIENNFFISKMITQNYFEILLQLILLIS